MITNLLITKILTFLYPIVVQRMALHDNLEVLLETPELKQMEPEFHCGVLHDFVISKGVRGVGNRPSKLALLSLVSVSWFHNSVNVLFLKIPFSPCYSIAQNSSMNFHFHLQKIWGSIQHSLNSGLVFLT